MVKRKFNDDEMKVSLSNIETLGEDLEYLEKVLIPQKSLALEIAPISYKFQLKQLEKELKIYNNKQNQFVKSIELLQNQINNGVEMIEQNKKEVE